MTYCLDVDQVLEIHDVAGGSGVRDLASLEASLARPMQTIGGVDAYPTVVAKAAALLHGLARTQPFFDGNKRTAWVCCTTYLELHEHVISPTVTDQDVVDFVMEIAVGGMTVDAIALQLIEWLA